MPLRSTTIVTTPYRVFYIGGSVDVDRWTFYRIKVTTTLDLTEELMTENNLRERRESPAAHADMTYLVVYGGYQQQNFINSVEVFEVKYLSMLAYVKLDNRCIPAFISSFWV